MNKPDYISAADWQILKSKYSEKKIIKQLKKNYPYQYMIGNVEFYNSIIYVNKNVLIPRWETEELVNRVVTKLKDYNPHKGLDICTGSGCIAIAISKALNIPFDAIDVSSKALKMAKKNICENKANVALFRKNVLKEINNNKYDLIVCNPPYVSKKEKVGKETKYEPQNALYAKNNGLEFYYTLLKKIPSLLEERYFIAFEIGSAQKKEIFNITKNFFPSNQIFFEKDLNNRDRYLFITNIE